MKFLPFDNFKIETHLSFDEVHRRLDNSVEPRKAFSLMNMMSAAPEKPYVGEVLEDSFKIQRVIKYRNSFLPLIHGKIIDNYPGTTLQINSRLPIAIYLFMLVWFSGVGMAVYFTVTEMFPMAVIPIGMLLFGYFLMTLPYKYEIRKTKRFLLALFEEQLPPEDDKTPMEDAMEKLMAKSKEAQ